MTNSIATEHKKIYFGLDSLRALAITLVVIYHYRMFSHPDWIDKSWGFGWAGVDLFFVLSGFLIASPLFNDMLYNRPISLPVFYIKRGFRIIPVYLVVLAIYFTVPAFWERPALPPLWKFLTFTQNFGFVIKNFGTFSHAWSLCVEEHFYLILPFVLISLTYCKAARKGWILLLTLFLAGFIVRWGCWHFQVAPYQGQSNFGVLWYRFIYYPTYNRLDGLLAGVAIAALFTFRPAIRNWVYGFGNIIFVIGIVILAGAWFLCRNQHSFYATVFGFPVVSIGYGFLVMAAICPTCFLYRFKSRTLSLIARLSYALYLAHKGIIHIVHPLFAKAGIDPKGNLMLVLCLLTALAGAYLLNLAIEKPFFKIKESNSGQKKALPSMIMVAPILKTVFVRF